MKVFFYILVSTIGILNSYAQVPEPNLNQEVDHYVATIMERYGIPGVAVGIVKDGKVVHKNYYGNANLEHGVPVRETSIFRVYSLTKTFVATAIFQLIGEQKLSLGDTVDKYVDGLPKTWQKLTVQHFLVHASGLPDMAPIMEFENLTEKEAKTRVFETALRSEAGEEYDYNQTNYWLLQQIIEKVSGMPIEDFVIGRQFPGSKDLPFFSSDSRDIFKNRVTPYFPFRTGKLIIDNSYLQGRYMLAANGFNLSLQNYLEWDSRFSSQGLLNKSTEVLMFEPFKYKGSEKQFAHGWDIHNLNGHLSYGFSGSLVTAYRIFPKDGLSIVFLSNGLSHYYDIENVVNHLASLIDASIVDFDYHLFEKLLAFVDQDDFTGLLSNYKESRTIEKYLDVNFESILNSIGYQLLQKGDTENALEVFLLNTKEFPGSWNVWDSLAEGYENSGDKEKALLYYKKSIAINPDNTHGKQKILDLESK